MSEINPLRVYKNQKTPSNITPIAMRIDIGSFMTYAAFFCSELSDL